MGGPVVAHVSFPNDAYNDRVVTLAEYEQVAGVAAGLSGMQYYTGTPPVFADATGRQVKLRADVSAWVRGTRFNNSTETIIPIAANTSGKTRIDLVVLRKRRQESSVGAGDHHTVAPFVIQGVPADTPIAPAPVRSTASTSSFWDLTLAEVTVPHNAASISAAQAVCRAYYTNGMGYTGRDAWSKPPVDPGVIFYAADTGKTYIGSASGSWLVLYDDSGWVSVPLEGGWSKGETGIARVRRINRVAHLSLDLFRTGNTLSSGSVLVAKLPNGFGPEGAGHIVPGAISGAGSVRFVIAVAGTIRIDNFSQLTTGRAISVATTWPLDD